MKHTTYVAFGLALIAGLALASLPASAQNAWGTIKGRIVWKGDLPKRESLEAAINKTQDKAFCLSKGEVISERFVVNDKNKGVRWTFVFMIHDANAKLPMHPDLKDPPKKPVVIDQPLCMFIPHALGLREKQELLVKNSATIAHSFKWGSAANPGANRTIPAGGELSITDLVADKQPVRMECAIHPWMNGTIMVFDHPYFTVTDENGQFEIKNAPAGKFRIVARHSTGLWVGGSFKGATKNIQVKGGDVLDMGNWEFTAPKD
jgi:hypothetical protein